MDPQAAPALSPEFLGWVRGVDLLLPNADELAALGGDGAGGDVLDAVGAFAVTDGARGARWSDPRGSWSVPAPETQVADVTGAGDAFDAGVLRARLGGASPPDALRAGCRAGAHTG